MKFYLIIFLSLFSLRILASDRNVAYYNICNAMNLDDGRHDCTDHIGGYEYFNEDATKICGRLISDAGKMDCLEAIGNKTFDSYEISDCANSSSDIDIVNCFRRRGHLNYSSTSVPVPVAVSVPVPAPIPVYYPQYYPRPFPGPYYRPFGPHYHPHFYPGPRPLFGVGFNIHIR
jgi:hypothetical protein